MSLTSEAAQPQRGIDRHSAVRAQESGHNASPVPYFEASQSFASNGNGVVKGGRGTLLQFRRIPGMQPRPARHHKGFVVIRSVPVAGVGGRFGWHISF
jgi:hypothetical protein